MSSDVKVPKKKSKRRHRGASIRIGLAAFHRGHLSRNTLAGGESCWTYHARTILVLTVICSAYLYIKFIENTV